MNVGLLYSGEIRDNGTGFYVKHALQSLGVEFTHYWPQTVNYDQAKHEVWLVVDDGRDELEHKPPHPCGFWAVDTHLGWDVRRKKAEHFDVVWVAQKPAAERMKAEGIDAHWLPLACSPEHHPTAVELAAREDKPLAEKLYDIAFVGHIQDPNQSSRIRYLDALFKAFPNFRYEYGRFHEDMAKVYHLARLGINHAIGADRDDGVGDLNMRFFELASVGVPQLCDSRMVGLEDLGFEPFVDYIPYASSQEAVVNARMALGDPDLPVLAGSSKRKVRATHTYEHRVGRMLWELNAL